MTWSTQVLVLQPVKPWQVLLFQLVVKQGQPETYATDGSGNSVTTVNLNAVAYATAKDGT